MNNDSILNRAIQLRGEATRAIDEGRLRDARSMAEESVALFERESGPVHPDVANVLNCLASVHEQSAEYPAAEACSRRAVDIMRDVRAQATGADIDRLYVQSLIGLGNINRILGRYGDAEAVLREAVTCAESALGDDDEDLVSSLNALGMLFKYSGRFDDASALYERAIQIAERISGPDHPSLASLFHNVGGLAHARGDYAGGEAAARRSVELRERAVGPDHPLVAADIAALAAIVDGLGRYDEAEEMYLRALAIFERVYQSGHSEIAVNLSNLAGVHQSQGRLGDAEVGYRQALAMKESLLGTDHPDVAMTLNNLGCCWQTRVATAKPNRCSGARWGSSNRRSSRVIRRFGAAARITRRCCATWGRRPPRVRWSAGSATKTRKREKRQRKLVRDG